MLLDQSPDSDSPEEHVDRMPSISLDGKPMKVTACQGYVTTTLYIWREHSLITTSYCLLHQWHPNDEHQNGQLGRFTNANKKFCMLFCILRPPFYKPSGGVWCCWCRRCLAVRRLLGLHKPFKRTIRLRYIHQLLRFGQLLQAYRVPGHQIWAKMGNTG